MWAECTCGHSPHHNTHFWDGRLGQFTFCECCTICGKRRREHGPFMHHFVKCVCGQYQEVA